MRRNDKELRDIKAINSLLDTCEIGFMATISSDGSPIAKPLNYVRIDNAVYFHTAKEGEKIDDIKRDNRVSFTVGQPIAYIKAGKKACKAGFLYRSVIIKGRAFMINDQSEKKTALDALMQKHQPDGKFDPIDQIQIEKTGIVRIDIESMTAKEDLGKGKIREIVLKAISDGTPLPLVLDDIK